MSLALRITTAFGLFSNPKKYFSCLETKIILVANVLARKKGSRKRTVSNTENQTDKEAFAFDMTAKQQLFDELNIKGNLKAEKAVELLGYKPGEWELNYSVLEGNKTNKLL